MTYGVRYTNKFLKDVRLAKKRQLDTSLLHDIVEKLRTGQKLDEKHHDHQLSGDYAGIRFIWTCHFSI